MEKDSKLSSVNRISPKIHIGTQILLELKLTDKQLRTQQWIYVKGSFMLKSQHWFVILNKYSQDI